MACDDHDNLWEALEPGSFSPYDFAVCPYNEALSAPIFAMVVLVGVVNLPIYIRQDSMLIPFVLTLALGGLVLGQAAAPAQAAIVVVVLLLVGLGPVGGVEGLVDGEIESHGVLDRAGAAVGPARAAVKMLVEALKQVAVVGPQRDADGRIVGHGGPFAAGGKSVQGVAA